MKKSVLKLLVLMAVLALGATATAAATEAPAELKPGSRVRVTVPRSATNPGDTTRLTGRLVSLTETEITLETSASKPPVIVPRASALAFEQSVRPGRRGQGALIGLGFGVLVGVVSGLADGDDAPGIVSFSAGQKAAIFAVVFAPVGALVGLVASSGEQWQALPADQIQVGLSRGPAGEPGFSLAFRF